MIMMFVPQELRVGTSCFPILIEQSVSDLSQSFGLATLGTDKRLGPRDGCEGPLSNARGQTDGWAVSNFVGAR